MTDTRLDELAPVIEREALVNPEEIPAPELAALPEDKDVTLKQSRFTAILKDAQSRAAKELRQRTADLERENAHLKSIAAGSAEGSTELDKARAETAALKMENDAIRATSQRQARDAFIAEQAQKNAFLAQDVVVKLTRDNLQWNGTGFTVVDDSGQPRTAADGTPLTPEAFYQEYATQRPYLVKGQVRSGGGGTSSSGSPTHTTDRYAVETLWGPNARADAGKVLNEWSLRDKRGYDQARASARAKGLV